MSSTPIPSRLRLSGLVSGLDTESMVKSLMKVEKLKVDRIWQQKTRLEWQREARQALDQKITEFRRTTMSALSPETNLMSAGAFNTFNAIAQSANPSVQIVATETAAAGLVVIDRIDRLATADRVSSLAAVASEPLNRSIALSDLPLSTPLAFDANQDIAFKINDVLFTFKATDTLQTMFSTINSSTANVSMGYSELTNAFSLSSLVTGEASTLTIENLSGNAFGTDPTMDPPDETAVSALGLFSSRIEAGQDALLSINGTPLSRGSNSFTIDGLRIQLSEPIETSLRFSIIRNIEPAVKKIQAFVHACNTLVDYAQGKLGETVFRDFSPLTTDQRGEMNETEIKLWEDKAKSGLMRNDRNLSGLLLDMRRMLYDPVAGLGKSVASVGLRTGSYLEKGRIVLDEATLRQALTNNPEEVAQLFTRTGPSTDAIAKTQESGLLVRLGEAFSKFAQTDNLSTYTRYLTAYDKQINQLSNKLAAQEDAIWRKFSAMESALSTMQAQSSWLSQQLG
jgi:flagellar hook-associated protein 2